MYYSDLMTQTKNWMVQTFLQLNTDKEEVHIVGLDTAAPELAQCVLVPSLLLSSLNLKILESYWIIKTFSWSCFLHLQHIVNLMLCGVASWTRNENPCSCSMPYGPSQSTFHLPQSVVPPLPLTSPECSYKATDLTDLPSIHWLQFKFRIYCRVLVFMYRTVHEQAPEYICWPAPPPPHL